MDLARSTANESLLYHLEGRTMALAETADILIVVGTSLFVYPVSRINKVSLWALRGLHERQHLVEVPA